MPYALVNTLKPKFVGINANLQISITGFIRDHHEMTQQLERDDWVEVFGDCFRDAERKLLPLVT